MTLKEYREITGAGMVIIENEQAIIDKQWLVEKIANKYLDLLEGFEIDILDPIEIDSNINYDIIIKANILTKYDSYIVDIEEMLIVDENNREYSINYKISEIEDAIIDYLDEKLI